MFVIDLTAALSGNTTFFPEPSPAICARRVDTTVSLQRPFVIIGMSSLFAAFHRFGRMTERGDCVALRCVVLANQCGGSVQRNRRCKRLPGMSDRKVWWRFVPNRLHG